MSHRTQIILEDEQYELLRAESARTGLALGELVRRALSLTYGWTDRDAALRVLDHSFGAWRDRDEDGAAYVERIRPGLGHRLASR